MKYYSQTSTEVGPSWPWKENNSKQMYSLGISKVLRKTCQENQKQPPEVFHKKIVFLKNFTTFAGKFQSLFFKKVAGLRLLLLRNTNGRLLLTVYFV